MIDCGRGVKVSVVVDWTRQLFRRFQSGPCHCSGEELIQRVGYRLSTGEVVKL